MNSWIFLNNWGRLAKDQPEITLEPPQDKQKGDKAAGRVSELLSSIKEKHEHRLISSYYRGLANWPGFLDEAWSQIKPLVDSPAYEERKQELIEQALAGTRNLKIPNIKKPAIDRRKAQKSNRYSPLFSISSFPKCYWVLHV